MMEKMGLIHKKFGLLNEFREDWSDLKKLYYCFCTLDLRTGQLLHAQEECMKLQTDLYYMKWKFRYVSRRLKNLDPNEAVSEEELDEQIRSKHN